MLSDNTGTAEGQALVQMAVILCNILCKLYRKTGNDGCVQIITLLSGNDLPCSETNPVSIIVPLI